MQGPVENAFMIVCAGNAILGGAELPTFWPEAKTFRYLEICEFRAPSPSGKIDDEYLLVAADPMAWFETLRPWCKGLRLHCYPSTRGLDQKTDAPDRMLVGLVGGGPRWLIEAVGEGRSEVWEGFYRIGDKQAADGRIWRCTHVKQGEVNPDEITGPNIMFAMNSLRKILPEIEAYARERGLDAFADCFARASAAVKADDIGNVDISAEVYAWTGFHKMQLCWFEAIQHASVFGGMGSWNDVGASGDARYEELSERLFNTLNACTTGLANSTCPVFLSYM